MNTEILQQLGKPRPPSTTLEQRETLTLAVSRCLRIDPLDSEILGRNDSFALQRRPRMLADRRTAIVRLVRIGERLMEDGHTLEHVAAALESVSLHNADLLAGLSVPRLAITERLREHFRSLSEIIKINENCLKAGGPFGGGESP